MAAPPELPLPPRLPLRWERMRCAAAEAAAEAAAAADTGLELADKEDRGSGGVGSLRGATNDAGRPASTAWAHARTCSTQCGVRASNGCVWTMKAHVVPANQACMVFVGVRVLYVQDSAAKERG